MLINKHISTSSSSLCLFMERAPSSDMLFRSLEGVTVITGLQDTRINTVSIVVIAICNHDSFIGESSFSMWKVGEVI